jgi:hypothetical protein
MTEPQNEIRLKAEFRQLRETESELAADYRQLLARRSPDVPCRGFHPAVSFAAAAAVLALAIGLFLNMGRDPAMTGLVETAQPLPQTFDPVAAFEMPTDFLLDTPWFELARTTLDFDFEFPQLDIPESIADET